MAGVGCKTKRKLPLAHKNTLMSSTNSSVEESHRGALAFRHTVIQNVLQVADEVAMMKYGRSLPVEQMRNLLRLEQNRIGSALSDEDVLFEKFAIGRGINVVVDAFNLVDGLLTIPESGESFKVKLAAHKVDFSELLSFAHKLRGEAFAVCSICEDVDIVYEKVVNREGGGPGAGEKNKGTKGVKMNEKKLRKDSATSSYKPVTRRAGIRCCSMEQVEVGAHAANTTASGAVGGSASASWASSSVSDFGDDVEDEEQVDDVDQASRDILDEVISLVRSTDIGSSETPPGKMPTPKGFPVPNAMPQPPPPTGSSVVPRGGSCNGMRMPEPAPPMGSPNSSIAAGIGGPRTNGTPLSVMHEAGGEPCAQAKQQLIASDGQILSAASVIKTYHYENIKVVQHLPESLQAAANGCNYIVEEPQPPLDKPSSVSSIADGGGRDTIEQTQRTAAVPAATTEEEAIAAIKADAAKANNSHGDKEVGHMAVDDAADAAGGGGGGGRTGVGSNPFIMPRGDATTFDKPEDASSRSAGDDVEEGSDDMDMQDSDSCSASAPEEVEVDRDAALLDAASGASSDEQHQISASTITPGASNHDQNDAGEVPGGPKSHRIYQALSVFRLRHFSNDILVGRNMAALNSVCSEQKCSYALKQTCAGCHREKALPMITGLPSRAANDGDVGPLAISRLTNVPDFTDPTTKPLVEITAQNWIEAYLIFPTIHSMKTRDNVVGHAPLTDEWTLVRKAFIFALGQQSRKVNEQPEEGREIKENKPPVSVTSASAKGRFITIISRRTNIRQRPACSTKSGRRFPPPTTA
eukprot:g504.t1